MKILTNVEYLGVNEILPPKRTYRIFYIEVTQLSPEKIARAMNFKIEQVVYGDNVSDVLKKYEIDLVFNSTVDSIIDSGR